MPELQFTVLPLLVSPASMGTRTLARRLAIVATIAALAGTSVAAEIFVYPQKGQSQEQQNKDSSECYGWAKNQSGVDPGQPPPQGRRGPS
jgi:hypothetical protein